MPPTLHTTATARVKALDFSEDGSGLLAAGLFSGEVHVVAADDGAPYRLFRRAGRPTIRAVKFIPGVAAPLDLSAPGFGPAPGSVETSPPLRPSGCREDDGTWTDTTAPPSITTPCHLAAGCDDTNVYLYDVHGDALLRTIKAHGDYIRAIALDPASPVVVTTSDDETARVWSRSFDRCQILEGHQHYVMAAAVATLSHRATPDGTSRMSTTLVATASLDTTVMLWFVEGGHESMSKPPPSCTLEGHTQCVNTVAFVRPSLERLFVVSGADDHEIRVWDAATHHCVAVLVGHTDNVAAVLCYQHAQGSLVSVGWDQRAIHWALSDMNDRAWCAGAFEDAGQNDTDEEANPRSAAETSGDDEVDGKDRVLDATAFKRRAVREKTDLMFAPSAATSGRGWALATTARNGQLLVAIGTDNGFDVAVHGTVPPPSASRSGTLASNRAHHNACSELVVGSRPDVVDIFHFRDDTDDDRSLPNDSGSSDDDNGLDMEDQRPLRLSASEELKRSQTSRCCAGLRRASPAAMVVMAFVSVLSVGSLVLWFSAAVVLMNVQTFSHFFGSIFFLGFAFAAISFVALKQKSCGSDCSVVLAIVLSSAMGFSLSFLHLLPSTLRRLVNRCRPYGVPSRRHVATYSSLDFARSLALRPWWRWVTTTALAEPFGRVAITASISLLPHHIAFVYATLRIPGALYTTASAVFAVCFCVSILLCVPALVPVPRAAVFVLCTIAFDYATWVEMAATPGGTPAFEWAWAMACLMIFTAAVVFVVGSIFFSHNGDRSQPAEVRVYLAIVVLMTLPLSIPFATWFCAALFAPALLLHATSGPATFSILRSRALFHIFCDEGPSDAVVGSPSHRALSGTIARRTAALINVHGAHAAVSVEDPEHFPPPPAALFGQKKRVVCSRPGTRFFTSEVDAPWAGTVPPRDQTVIVLGGELWDPVVQLNSIAAATFDDDVLFPRHCVTLPPRCFEAFTSLRLLLRCILIGWDLMLFACRLSKAVVLRPSQVSWQTKTAILLTIVLFPLRLLFAAAVVVVTLTTAPTSNNAFLQLSCLATRGVMTIGMIVTAAAFLRFAARHVFLSTEAAAGVSTMKTEWSAVVAATREPSSVVVRHAVPSRVVPTVVVIWYVAPFIAPTVIRQ